MQPNTVKRDSATDRRDSATDRRDSATYKRRDSATDKRDSATGRRGSVTDRQDSATDRRDSVTDRRDSATNRRDSATDRRDSATDKRDTATNRRDSATNRRDSATYNRRDSATDKPDSATDRRDSATYNRRDSATDKPDSVTDRRDSATYNRRDSATYNRRDSATDKLDSVTDRRDSATYNRRDSATDKPDSATDRRDSATYNRRDSATDKPDSVTDRRDSATDTRDSATKKPDSATDKQDNATNVQENATDRRDNTTNQRDGDNINNTQSSTVTFSERKNTEYYYTQEETDENSPKTKIEQIEQKGFFRLSEFERGISVCLVILVIYTVVMSVFYIMYSEGMSHKVHILRVHDDPNARVVFKSLGPPIAFIKESFPFIASIIDRVFYDDPSEYKFRCSAVLLKNNTVLAASTCISNTKYNQTQKVRILSSLWSEIGYLHDILDYKNIKNWFVAIKLDNPFHNLNSKNNAQLLTPEEFKNINKTADIVTSYCWDHSYFASRDLRKRNKYDVLSKKELKVARNKECKNYPENFDGLCAIEHINIREFLIEQLDGRDSIFLKDSNRLIGIEIKRELWNNSIEHYYQFVKNTVFF